MECSKTMMIKFMELTLTIVICILHSNSLAYDNSTTFLITTGTYVGYVIILIGVFMGHFTGSPISTQLDMFYSLVGAALYIASGILSYDYFTGVRLKTTYTNTGIIKAWISIANGVIFAVDAVFLCHG